VSRAVKRFLVIGACSALSLWTAALCIDEAKIERVVALTNEARPDLLLLAGAMSSKVLSAASPLAQT